MFEELITRNVCVKEIVMNDIRKKQEWQPGKWKGGKENTTKKEDEARKKYANTHSSTPRHDISKCHVNQFFFLCVPAFWVASPSTSCFWYTSLGLAQPNATRVIIWAPRLYHWDVPAFCVILYNAARFEITCVIHVDLARNPEIFFMLSFFNMVG